MLFAIVINRINSISLHVINIIIYLFLNCNIFSFFIFYFFLLLICLSRFLLLFSFINVSLARCCEYEINNFSHVFAHLVNIASSIYFIISFSFSTFLFWLCLFGCYSFFSSWFDCVMLSSLSMSSLFLSMLSLIYCLIIHYRYLRLLLICNMMMI